MCTDTHLVDWTHPLQKYWEKEKSKKLYSHPAGYWSFASLLPHKLTPPQEQLLTYNHHRRRPKMMRRQKQKYIQQDHNITHIERSLKNKKLIHPFGQLQIKEDTTEINQIVFHQKLHFTLALLGSPSPFPLRSRGTAPCSLAPLNRSSTTSLELFFLGGPTICCPLRSEPPAKNLRWETEGSD